MRRALAESVDVMPGKTPWAVVHLSQCHLLPKAYLYGPTKQQTGVPRGPGFLFGMYYEQGSWMYFPVVLLIKCCLTLLLLTVLTTSLIWRGTLP